MTSDGSGEWRYCWIPDDEFWPAPDPELGGWYFLKATRADDGRTFYAPMGSPNPWPDGSVPYELEICYTGDYSPGLCM